MSRYEDDDEQKHVHEFVGSTQIADEDDPHNHRVAGVSGEAICVRGGHVHVVCGRTDFFDHFHEFKETSSLQKPVGNGKHVHFVETRTTCEDGHTHKLIFATLIEAPLLDEYEDCED